jgi:hypothetical protein
MRRQLQTLGVLNIVELEAQRAAIERDIVVQRSRLAKDLSGRDSCSPATTTGTPAGSKSAGRD